MISHASPLPPSTWCLYCVLAYNLSTFGSLLFRTRSRGAFRNWYKKPRERCLHLNKSEDSGVIHVINQTTVFGKSLKSWDPTWPDLDSWLTLNGYAAKVTPSLMWLDGALKSLLVSALCLQRRTTRAAHRIMKILNVAEKNDAAKNIADILSGGRFNRVGFLLDAFCH